MSPQQEKLQQDAAEVLEKRMPFLNKNKEHTISVEPDATHLTVTGLDYEEEVILKEILRKEYGYANLK
ncbi:hypothetical protein GCM10028803_31830 [Larkinella knui]|uniref:Heavy-metal-associated domain-containing protein n=1 Tax=Larkinella knui TaxID=2025310 RepID=A0A3P1CZ94_9BACT|nr:hypothetical protein [Larkinella knui]RRB18204.1 hypothetical protein EHT87_07995 [Larkinella knui]